MNPRQKCYDSYDKTNKLLKLTNSYYHFKNLEFIKNRKSHYNQKPFMNLNKKNYNVPFRSYFIQTENKNIENKLTNIRLKRPKPIINSVFLQKESKMQEFRKLYKNMDIQKREDENKNYKKRIKNQKAFLNPLVMDKNFKEEHSKSLLKLKKIGEHDNIILPRIKKGSPNPHSVEPQKRLLTDTKVNKD